jgi:membrane protease YdiL (CAAX protease family)
MLGAAMAGELEIILILLAIAAPVLWMVGVFKARTVVGPPRMLPGESTMSLMGILVLSCCLALFAVVVLRPVIHHLFSKAHTLDLLNAAAELIALVALFFLTARLRPRGIAQLGLTTRKFFWAPPLAFLTAWAAFPLVYAASFLVQLVIELTHHAMPPAHPILQQLEGSHSPLWIAIMVVEAVVLAPLVEETIFRGHVQTIIAHLFRRGESPPAWARWVAIIVTAMLFAAAHGQIAFLFPLFVLAIGLGYLYERTGNLWASVFTHGLFNALQIVIYLGGAK